MRRPGHAGRSDDGESAGAFARRADRCAPEASPTGPLFPRIIGSTQPWELPKVEDIFEAARKASLSEDDLRDKAHIIEDTLHAFGVEGKVSKSIAGRPSRSSASSRVSS